MSERPDSIDLSDAIAAIPVAKLEDFSTHDRSFANQNQPDHFPGLRKISRLLGLVVVVLVLGLLTTACNLPQVTAEERLFLNLSVDFLGEYQLPKQTFEDTPVGGLSAITYDRPRDRFYALSDDRGDLAPARFYTLKLDLDSTNAAQPKLRKVTIEKVTTLKSETGRPYAKGTIDPEGIALSGSSSVFVSSEGVTHDRIPPFVGKFDLSSGAWAAYLNLPERYIPDAPEDAKQTRGIRDNQGFESLTLNPGGYGATAIEPFRLFTAVEAPLAQDLDRSDPKRSLPNRMLHYLVQDEGSLLASQQLISEHLYPLEPTPIGAFSHGLTELLAIDQGGHFLSLERTFGLTGFKVKLFQLTSGGATDTSTIASLKGAPKGLQPIRKQLLLDLSTLGIRLDNLEGMTIGSRLPDGSQSLILISDDNFRAKQVNQFLLLRLKGLT